MPLPANETLFEGIWRKLDEYDAAPEASDVPPAYVLYRNRRFGVMALADAFPKFPHQVVITPREGCYGQKTSVYDMAPSRRLQLELVAQAIGKKLLSNAPEQRVIEHVEGYAVPDHPHIVMFSAERNQGVKLYGKAEPASADTLEATRCLLQIDGDEAAELDSRLQTVEDITLLLDKPSLCLSLTKDQY